MLENHSLSSAGQAGRMFAWLCFFVSLFLWVSSLKQAKQKDAEKVK